MFVSLLLEQSTTETQTQKEYSQSRLASMEGGKKKNQLPPSAKLRLGDAV